jgi:hypothetical protein
LRPQAEDVGNQVFLIARAQLEVGLAVPISCMRDQAGPVVAGISKVQIGELGKHDVTSTASSCRFHCLGNQSVVLPRATSGYPAVLRGHCFVFDDSTYLGKRG